MYYFKRPSNLGVLIIRTLNIPVEKWICNLQNKKFTMDSKYKEIS